MPDRPPDFSMNTNLHHAFKREVARLRKGVQRVDLADRAATEGLARRFAFFSATLHHHHQGEDQYLFDRVRPRATPEEVAVLDAMDAEHGALKLALDRLDHDFRTLSPDSDPATIAADFDELHTVLDAHCAHEERAGVPIVQKHVTSEDLKEFMTYTRSAPDSMMVLAWACDGATSEQEASTWGMLPPFVRVFVKPLSTRKYRAFTAACGM